MIGLGVPPNQSIKGARSMFGLKLQAGPSICNRGTYFGTVADYSRILKDRGYPILIALGQLMWVEAIEDLTQVRSTK